jgi:hypothetical protein
MFDSSFRAFEILVLEATCHVYPKKAADNSKYVEPNNVAALKSQIEKQVGTLGDMLQAVQESNTAWTNVIDKAAAVSLIMAQSRTEGNDELAMRMQETALELKISLAKFKIH